jgi:hypothetical protein
VPNALPLALLLREKDFDEAMFLLPTLIIAAKVLLATSDFVTAITVLQKEIEPQGYYFLLCRFNNTIVVGHVT